jgi:FMN-dependent NADH-azoreductase
MDTMNLLHLDASILGANSASRQLSAALVDSLKKANPGLTYVYRDLAAEPLGHLTSTDLPGQADNPALAEFLAADTVVIGAPMYNFTLPSQLKAWIDRIVVAGKTFRYSAAGVPEGLAGNKRVIIAISRGGLYGAGAPAAAMEHAESYLRVIFGFIGVTPEFVIAEGLLLGPENRAKSIATALDVATQLKAA